MRLSFIFMSMLLVLSWPTRATSLVGLAEGIKVPELSLQTTSGNTINIGRQEKTTVLVFYRGSWCPYCVKQLKDIEETLMPNLPKNVQVLAISVDRLKVAKKMKKKQGLSFVVISDPKATSLKSFRIANKISDELNKKYKSTYKIDIEADSGEKHHLVAHPAVFVVKDNKIAFRDVHIDYKMRTSTQKILSVLKSLR